MLQPIPRLALFASGWSFSSTKAAVQAASVGGRLGLLDCFLTECQLQGFSGVELSLSDLGADTSERAAVKKQKLRARFAS